MADHRMSGDEEDEWEDDDLLEEVPSDDDIPSLLCFFCSEQLPRFFRAQEHLLQAHQFDFSRTVANLGVTDDYEYIRFINFVRKEALSSDFAPRLAAKEWSNEDSWLRPTLATDTFLSLDLQDIVGAAVDGPSPPADTGPMSGRRSPAEAPLAVRMRLAETRAFRAEEELAEAQRELAAMRRCMRRIVMDNNDDEAPSQPSSSPLARHLPNGPLSPSAEDDDEEDPCGPPDLLPDTSHSSDSVPLPPERPQRIIFARRGAGGGGGSMLTDGYFESYDRPSIHEEMLHDRVRTEAYRQFIVGNAERLFRGKRVLDLGCGTGILSMMAARAGASVVHAVDRSDMIFTAMEIARENDLHDKIAFHHGRVEDIYYEFGTIDVVISEWMGYFLLFESMLDSVLFCRERLSPRPRLFPRFYRLLMVGLDDGNLAEEKVSCWDDFYGFRMSALRRQVLAEAAVRCVPGQAVVTDACEVSAIDLDSCGLDWQVKGAPLRLVIRRPQAQRLTALAGYFDTSFESEDQCDRTVNFSTGPLSPPTHWKQTVFVLREALSVKDGDIVTGSISVERSQDDMRSLTVDLSLDGPDGTKIRQKFTMD